MPRRNTKVFGSDANQQQPETAGFVTAIVTASAAMALLTSYDTLDHQPPYPTTIVLFGESIIAVSCLTPDDKAVHHGATSRLFSEPMCIETWEPRGRR